MVFIDSISSSVYLDLFTIRYVNADTDDDVDANGGVDDDIFVKKRVFCNNAVRKMATSHSNRWQLVAAKLIIVAATLINTFELQG